MELNESVRISQCAPFTEIHVSKSYVYNAGYTKDPNCPDVNWDRYSLVNIGKS